MHNCILKRSAVNNHHIYVYLFISRLHDETGSTSQIVEMSRQALFEHLSCTRQAVIKLAF